MSLDASRDYIFPLERVAEAFAAAAELALPQRDPRDHEIALPNGSSIVFPFAPDSKPPYVLELDDFLSLDYRFRASGDDIEEYVRENPEPPFTIKRLKGGGLRGTFELRLIVSVEPPYVSFSFCNQSNADCDVVFLPSVCDVLDHIGNSAQGIVTYQSVMGDRKILEPFEEDLPSSGFPSLASIVDYVHARESA